MRGPQCVRAAMLSLWGHLSRLPVPPWGFSSAHPRGHLCSLSRDYPVWDPAWALGVPLPGPRAGHGTPGFSFWPPRSALACLLPRSGRRRAGERGAGGRDHPFFRPGAHGRGPSFREACPSVPATSVAFFTSKGAWGRGEKGSPAPGLGFGVWGDRSTLCFESWVRLTPSNFTSSLDTHCLSSNIYGEWPSRAAEEWNGWHTNGLERKMGDGGQLLFPSPFQAFFNFLPGLRVPFQH